MSHLSEDRFDELVGLEREREHPPLNTWSQIAELAREEGLIRDSRRSFLAMGRPWMQAAAGIVILLGGVAIGRTIGAERDALVATSGPATARPETVDEAVQKLNQASEQYQSAAAFLAAQNVPSPAVADSVQIYRDRLAALEQLMNATETAREQAPSDPVINQYYLATLGAREATVQLLGTARPARLTKVGF
jgi:hypothetical protein